MKQVGSLGYYMTSRFLQIT